MIPELDSFLAELAKLGKSMARLGRALATPTGKRKASGRRVFWTRKEIQLIRKLYPNMRTDDLAKQMGRSERAVYAAANGMGLHKSKAYLASGLPDMKKKGGNGGSFKKGQTSWNKGRKGACAPGSEKGWFQKGRKPRNTWKPIGSETVTKDGYLVRKVTDVGGYNNDDWKFVSHLEWEKHHGPVPKGSMVGFKNGDKRDFRIENLELRTMAQNMQNNTYHNYPEPIKDLIHMRAVLTRAINKRKKNEND